MKRLKHGDRVVLYHDISPEGDHSYYFFDMEKRVMLDWGEIGHVPNYSDRFDHPQRDVTLKLDGILWGEDDP